MILSRWRGQKGEYMQAYFKVNKLNNNGLFVSDIDWDDGYKDKSNPKGNFVIIIEPLEGFDKDIIYYQKIEDGFLVEGEGYILTGRKDILKKRISKWTAEYKQKDFEFKTKKIRE